MDTTESKRYSSLWAAHQDLRQKYFDLANELEALKALDRGDLPAAYMRKQCKIERQRAALDALNRKVTSQRLVLRTINELGRGLTAEEWAEAKAKVNEQVAERLDETVLAGV